VTGLRGIAVVVPARDEAALIQRSLRSLSAAAAHASNAWGESCPDITIVVVADRCDDTTAALARRVAGVQVIEVDFGSVGRARASGIQLALRTLNTPSDATWIANTDADSVVPFNWLTTHAAYADAGNDLVIGTVRPDFADLSPEQITAWKALHTPGFPNGHVHGANLGVRASSYLAAGGFAPVGEHEDVQLVQRLHDLGSTFVATDLCEVVTSGRGHGRTPGGYARYLRDDLIARSLDALGANAAE
jgi:glycosyltransferase involved in cell wall biosynthesis